MNSITEHLIATSAFKLPSERTFSDALAYAIEGHFRVHPELGSIDGFYTFHVQEESERRLVVVAIAWFLDFGLLPLKATFEATEQDVVYEVFLAIEDQRLTGLSEKKRWWAWYQYATEDIQPPWGWQAKMVGSVG